MGDIARLEEHRSFPHRGYQRIPVRPVSGQTRSRCPAGSLHAAATSVVGVAHCRYAARRSP